MINGAHVEQRRKWHINRGVSLEAIAAYAVIFGSVFVAWMNLNSRVSVQEAVTANLVADALKRSDEVKIAAAVMGERLNRMEDKIDQLRRDLLERKK